MYYLYFLGISKLVVSEHVFLKTMLWQEGVMEFIFRLCQSSSVITSQFVNKFVFAEWQLLFLSLIKISKQRL